MSKSQKLQDPHDPTLGEIRCLLYAKALNTKNHFNRDEKLPE